MKRTTLKRTKLKIKGTSDKTVLKDEIQFWLRAICVVRDGGCFLRHFKNEIEKQYGECGGWRKDGSLILQAEHLHTRANNATFADERLVVCICKRHHQYYKPQFSADYNDLASRYIGPKNTALWELVRKDKSINKVDLKLSLAHLKSEFKKHYKKVDDKWGYQWERAQKNTEKVFYEIIEACL